MRYPTLRRGTFVIIGILKLRTVFRSNCEHNNSGR